jgi:hypothetical protein
MSLKKKTSEGQGVEAEQESARGEKESKAKHAETEGEA